jgi:putative DNA primase/helicase
VTDYVTEIVEATSKVQGDFGLDQQEAARAFLTTFDHEMRWVQAEKTWFVASREPGARFWAPEALEDSMARMTVVCRLLSQPASPSDKKRMRQASFARGALDVAKPSVAVTPDAFNRDPMLLGGQNGVVDLATGKIRDVVPEDMLTRRCAVPYPDEDAECPKWLDHLRVLTRSDEDFNAAGDNEMIGYLQELAGMSLIGAQVEHCFILMRGDGRNGKGVFTDTLRDLLGDYGDILDDMVLYQDAGAHTTGLTDLRGMRFVSKDEVDSRRVLNTPLLKALTGGGPMKARRIRENNVSWQKTHTLWLVSNFQPNLGVDSSTGLWDRVLIVETGPSIPKHQRRPDSEVRGELVAEGPGILRWAVAGAMRYVERGRLPDMPLRVQTATESFQQGTRLMRAFLDQRTASKIGSKVLLKDVRGEFVDWLEGEGIKPKEQITSGLVGQLLKQEGVRVDTSTGNQLYAFDIRLLGVLEAIAQ